MKGIKFILFDWGGTLGIPGHRMDFVNKGTGFLPGAKSMLKDLNKNYILGMISNTHVTAKQMAQGLKKSNLSHLFKIQVYSSDPGLCSKPCKEIYQRAWSLIKKISPNPRKNQVLYVGNNYFYDIVPAWRFGFNTALVSNGYHDPIYRLAQIAGVQTIALDYINDLVAFI